MNSKAPAFYKQSYLKQQLEEALGLFFTKDNIKQIGETPGETIYHLVINDFRVGKIIIYSGTGHQRLPIRLDYYLNDKSRLYSAEWRFPDDDFNELMLGKIADVSSQQYYLQGDAGTKYLVVAKIFDRHEVVFTKDIEIEL